MFVYLKDINIFGIENGHDVFVKLDLLCILAKFGCTRVSCLTDFLIRWFIYYIADCKEHVRSWAAFSIASFILIERIKLDLFCIIFEKISLLTGPRDRKGGRWFTFGIPFTIRRVGVWSELRLHKLLMEWLIWWGNSVRNKSNVSECLFSFKGLRDLRTCMRYYWWLFWSILLLTF
jgi:hypothetical protein